MGNVFTVPRSAHLELENWHKKELKALKEMDPQPKTAPRADRWLLEKHILVTWKTKFWGVTWELNLGIITESSCGNTEMAKGPHSTPERSPGIRWGGSHKHTHTHTGVNTHTCVWTHNRVQNHTFPPCSALSQDWNEASLGNNLIRMDFLFWRSLPLRSYPNRFRITATLIKKYLYLAHTDFCVITRAFSSESKS